MKHLLRTGWLLALLGSFFLATAQPKGNGKPMGHSRFSKLLRKHVGADGLVNYASLKRNTRSLDDYLAELSKNAPGDLWSKDEQLAYWINAYNAFTLKLVLDNYPLTSLKEAGPKGQVVFVNTAWDKKFFAIGGQPMSLNQIYHGVLRKKFSADPRFHFALNNGTLSGPRLRQDAYESDKLNEQLNEQATNFLTDPSRNLPAAHQLHPLFKWYGADFRVNGLTKLDYINQFAPTKLEKGTMLQYMDYDWRLNEKP